MIRATFSKCTYRPGKAEIKRAALLAYEGYLVRSEGSESEVRFLNIENVSITDIPRGHMEKLVSICTYRVWINNMTHTDHLGSILASVQCTELMLYKMELSEAETRALVTAMRDRVREVWLDKVILDIEELTKYNGKGHCSAIGVGRRTRKRHGDRLRRWAADNWWSVTWDDKTNLMMERISPETDTDSDSDSEDSNSILIALHS